MSLSAQTQSVVRYRQKRRRPNQQGQYTTNGANKKSPATRFPSRWHQNNQRLSLLTNRSRGGRRRWKRPSTHTHMQVAPAIRAQLMLLRARLTDARHGGTSVYAFGRTNATMPAGYRRPSPTRPMQVVARLTLNSLSKPLLSFRIRLKILDSLDEFPCVHFCTLRCKLNVISLQGSVFSSHGR